VIAAQLLFAADFMQKKNVIHRDLKPENILFSSKAEAIHDVRIADLGFAVVIKDEDSKLLKCGTPAYCAPEILLNKRMNYSFKVDIYSIGCIIYYIITGSHFFFSLQSFLKQGHPMFTGVSSNTQSFLKLLL
jgi:calcium/calmodulin-dependent protein kinase I